MWGLSAFAFDVAPLYAQATTLKIAADTSRPLIATASRASAEETRGNCSLARGFRTTNDTYNFVVGSASKSLQEYSVPGLQPREVSVR